MNRIYQEIKITEIVNSSKTLVSSVDSENLDNISEDIAVGNEVCVMILNVDRCEVVVSKDVISDCTIHNYFITKTPFGNAYNFIRMFDLYERTKENGGSAMFHVSGRQSEKFRREYPGAANAADTRDSIIYIVNTKNKSGDTVAVFLNSVISPVTATVKTLRSLLLWLSFALIILALLMSFLISAKVSKPIANLSGKARELATGDYNVRFEGNGFDEVNELSESLNYAASELSKVDSLRSELLANISHDLRTPLTLIAGYAEVMRDIPDENTNDNLQIIIDESNRLTNLVRDAFDISLLQSGDAKFEFAEFAMTNCIESELTRYNKLRGCEGYTITFDYDALVTVNGDRQKIMQAVYNLVNNAVNYSGEDKTVRVKQSVIGDRVRISITDTGEGIPEDKLPLIWERYYKVDKTHRRAQVGTGLGLSIVKGIVEAHGGSYGVASEIGKGSTFFIEFDALSIEKLEENE